MGHRSNPERAARLAAIVMGVTASASLAGCAMDVAEQRGDGRDEAFLVGGKRDGLAGTADAEAVLELANTATVEVLDAPASGGGVGLDVRAATGIGQHRRGPDGEPGTADDDPFDDLPELDAIPYVGPVAYDRMRAFATGSDAAGAVHGIEPGTARARAVLAVANGEGEATLDAAAEDGGVGLDRRAAENIAAQRAGADGEPGTADDRLLGDLAELDAVAYVGARAFGKLDAHARRSPPCDPVQDFEMLLSNYDLNWTLGQGEHQGLAIRYRRHFADCRVDESIAYLFNHGRTISTARPEHTRVISHRARRLSPEELDAGADAYMEQCILAGAGTDGFCDAMCGNDGYTFPSFLLSSDRGTGGSSNDRFTAKSAFKGDTHRRKAVWAILFGDDYPAYGHNSSNDAEAELDMFETCDWSQAGDPAAFDDVITGVCERQCGGDFTAPGNPLRQNIAKPTVDFCDGCMNLPDDLPGDRPGRSPVAGSHGVPFEPLKRVHGLLP